jgi:quercetin dioxygenase-like cupin family protein
MKRILVLIATLVAALGTGTAALASDGHPITEKALGAASISQPYTIRVRDAADVLVATATVPRGASFGWHFHRSAAVVVVTSGTLTLYDSADPTCTAQRYSAGQGFVEHANHVHLARNEGSTRAVVVVTYLGLPHGVNPDVPVPSPGNCPF